MIRLILLLLVLVNSAGHAQGAGEDECQSIECIKQAIQHGQDTRIFRIAGADRAQLEGVEQRMHDALQAAKIQVDNDLAAERLFSILTVDLDPELIAKGIAFRAQYDQSALKYERIENLSGRLSEDVVVAGWVSGDNGVDKIHLMVGSRNKDHVFEIAIHIAADVGGDKSAHRIVRGSDEYTMNAGWRASAEQQADEASNNPTVANGAGAIVPNVEWFGFFNPATEKYRIIAICWSNNSQGLMVKVCYDSGWMA